MKYLVVLFCILLTSVSLGQVTMDDLPRPVARAISNAYKKQDISLEEIEPDMQEPHGNRFYALYSGNPETPSGYLYVGSVNTCRTGGCSGPASTDLADYSSEYFDYFILFTPEMAVQTVQVFNYQASYGHEIAARGWLKQFQDFRGEKSLEPGKDIDVISGATVSVHAITNDVQWKTRQLQQLAR